MTDYVELQRELASRGLVGCPISECEFIELVNSGISYDGALSVALDVACGFSYHEAWESYVEDLVQWSKDCEAERLARDCEAERWAKDYAAATVL